MSGRLAFIGIVMALASAAPAQTTRPAPAGWERTIHAFAAAMNSSDADDLKALLADRASIRQFSTSNSSDVEKLLSALGGRAILSAHAYVFPSTSYAQDLSDDAAASKLPDAVKKGMVLPDDEKVRQKATDTALKWIGQALGTSKGDLVAVIALWPADAASTDDTASRPMFIVIKGIEIAPDVFRVSMAVYGDPLGG